MSRYHVAGRGAAAVAELSPSGILLVRYVGAITGQSLPELKRPIAEQLGAGALALVADYSGAKLAPDDAGLDVMVAGEDLQHLPSLPSAVVAPKLDAWRLKMCAMTAAALHGRYRVVTRDRLEALAWAESMCPRRCWAKGQVLRQRNRGNLSLTHFRPG